MLERIKEFFSKEKTSTFAKDEVAIVPETLKECSECFSWIDVRARRCPYCTTVLIA
jgi:hypothetical protein